MFSTYGPFKLATHDKIGIDNLYKQITAADACLENAPGVYIVSSKTKLGELIPWYVGMTDAGFGKRLLSHFNSYKFEKLAKDNDGLFLFLIARVTGAGKPKKVGISPMPSIRKLEFALIGSALSVNENLLNKSGKTFHLSMKVPGFWNSKPSDYDDAARKLAKMLKPKKETK